MAVAIHETEAGGETFMVLGSTLLVKSKSTADGWYEIRDAQCSCPSFKWRHACRHVVAAAKLDSEASVTVERTDRFGGCWIVTRDGHLHGAGHYNEIDAQRHADELRQMPADEWGDWLTRHGYGAPVPLVPTGRPVLTLIEGAAR